MGKERGGGMIPYIFAVGFYIVADQIGAPFKVSALFSILLFMGLALSRVLEILNKIEKKIR